MYWHALRWSLVLFLVWAVYEKLSGDGSSPDRQGPNTEVALLELLCAVGIAVPITARPTAFVLAFAYAGAAFARLLHPRPVGQCGCLGAAKMSDGIAMVVSGLVVITSLEIWRASSQSRA